MWSFLYIELCIEWHDGIQHKSCLSRSSVFMEKYCYLIRSIELRSFYFLFQRNTVTLARRTGGLLYLVAGHALVAHPEN